jgi:hypothetical protein
MLESFAGYLPGLFVVLSILSLLIIILKKKKKIDWSSLCCWLLITFCISSSIYGYLRMPGGYTTAIGLSCGCNLLSLGFLLFYIFKK